MLLEKSWVVSAILYQTEQSRRANGVVATAAVQELACNLIGPRIQCRRHPITTAIATIPLHSVDGTRPSTHQTTLARMTHQPITTGVLR